MADLSITPANVLVLARGRVWLGVAGAPIDPGKTVYEDGATKRWLLASCRSELAPARRARGVALSTSSAGQPIFIAQRGPIDLGPILTPGAAYCLSAAAGGICEASDLHPADDVCFLGLATSVSELLLNIQYPDAFGGVADSDGELDFSNPSNSALLVLV